MLLNVFIVSYGFYIALMEIVKNKRGSIMCRYFNGNELILRSDEMFVQQNFGI